MTKRRAPLINRTIYPDTTAGRLMKAADLRWYDLAAASGCDQARLRNLIRRGVASHCRMDRARTVPFLRNFSLAASLSQRTDPTA